MTIGLYGKKIGMSREFFDSGISVPVTILSVEKGRILDVITKEKRGYNAIRVGFGKIKNSKLTKQMKGVFAKKATEPKKILKEGKVDMIVGFRKGTLSYMSEPFVARNEKDAEELIFDCNCRMNLVNYITNKKEKIGIIVKGCDSRNLVTHIVHQ